MVTTCQCRLQFFPCIIMLHCRAYKGHIILKPNACARSVSVSVSLSVRQTHESRNASTSRQTELYMPYSARGRGGSAAGRSATLEPSARKYVSACAVRSTRSSLVRHRPTACGLHCPFAAAVDQFAQQIGALTAQSSIRLENQRSHCRSPAFRFLRLSWKCSRPWSRRTVAVTFCRRASHADIDPELVQNTGEPGDHIQHRRPHHWCRTFFVTMPIKKLRDMSFEIRIAPCLLDESA